MFTSEARRQRPHRPVEGFLPNPKLRLREQCREVLRFKQMSPRTEEAYVDWMRRFILWAREGRDARSQKAEGGGQKGADHGSAGASP